MKYDDFNWDDIIMEAPNDQEGGNDLSASDYTDTDSLEINDVSGEEDLGAEDYTKMEEDDGTNEEDNSGEETTNDLNMEDDVMGEDDMNLDDEGSSDDMDGMDDETSEDEQQDNAENNDPQSQQNKYLAHDFIELYNRQQEIINKIRADKRLNSFVNPTCAQVKKNLEKLSKVTYDYIVDKFNKETYVANLYQFNLIIQAMNINVQMLEEVNERIIKEEEKQIKRKTKK